MEILNRDEIFEIAKYLFDYDLYNLKLALPAIKLNREIYLKVREERLKFLSQYRARNMADLYRNLLYSDFSDYAFKIIKIKKINKIRRKYSINVHPKLINDLLRLSQIEHPTIAQLISFSSFELEYYNVRNTSQLVVEIFKSREIKIEQLNGIYKTKSKEFNQFIQQKIKLLKLFDIYSYIRMSDIGMMDELIVSSSDLKIIYSYLSKDDQKTLMESINYYYKSGYHNPNIISQLHKFQLAIL